LGRQAGQGERLELQQVAPLTKLFSPKLAAQWCGAKHSKGRPQEDGPQTLLSELLALKVQRYPRWQANGQQGIDGVQNPVGVDQWGNFVRPRRLTKGGHCLMA